MTKRKPYKDHHLTYWDKKKKQYVYDTPKDWARQYRKYFPKKNFSDDKNTPTSDEIGRVLKDQFGFVEFTHEKVIVLCNFDTNRKDF